MKLLTPLTAALFALLISATGSFSQDAEAGKAVFKKCVACHKLGPDAKNGAGPILNGIVGRTAGTMEGFRYGADLVAAGEKGLVWTEALIAEYIEDPKDFLAKFLGKDSAKANMTFKLADENDRKDVAAYLANLEETDKTVAEHPVDANSDEELSSQQSFSEDFLADEQNIASGKEIWFAQCTHCHGSKAYPGKAPKLRPAKYTPEFVFKRVYHGFKKMPSWKDTYTVDEIRQIVSYVKSKGFSP